MIPVVVYYFSKVKRTTNPLILKVGGGKKELSFNAFRRPQRALLEIWEEISQLLKEEQQPLRSLGLTQELPYPRFMRGKSRKDEPRKKAL